MWPSLKLYPHSSRPALPDAATTTRPALWAATIDARSAAPPRTVLSERERTDVSCRPCRVASSTAHKIAPVYNEPHD